MKYRMYLSGILLSGFACMLGTQSVASGNHHGHDDHGDEHHEEMVKGPHGGRMLKQDDFTLELTIYETGVPPEFRAYAYQDGEALDPEEVKLRIELHRLGGDKDVIQFIPAGNYLRGNTEITEPHSFDVDVHVQYDGKSHAWKFESYEGRTHIEEAAAREAGISTSIAGPARIAQTEMLYGTVRPNEERVFRLRAPYAGHVRDVRVSVGDSVKAGDVLARVQSLESLETYSISAPADGVILSRHVNAGELTGDQALLVLADLSEVWVDFAAFPSQQKFLQKGQRVVIHDGGNRQRATAEITYFAPVGSSASQSSLVRVSVPNASGTWVPGLLVTGDVVIAENEVPLAVKTSALQTFRDFTVVFAKFGDTYEVRMLEPGRRDSGYVEVLSGLQAGTEYVSGNSYLIKADILKAGAGHHH